VSLAKGDVLAFARIEQRKFITQFAISAKNWREALNWRI